MKSTFARNLEVPASHGMTGAEVARVSTEPVRAEDALRHARSVGGPALRSLTMAEATVSCGPRFTTG